MNSFWQRKSSLVLGAVFCNALWGSASTCIKLGYSLFQVDRSDTFSQILFAGCRFTLAGIMVIIAGSFLARKPLIPGKSDIHPIIVLAIFQTIIQYFFFYCGLSLAAASITAIISASNTFFSILIAVYIFRSENMTTRKIFGCILGFAGILFIELVGTSVSVGFRLAGEGFILISCISSAISGNFIKKFSQKHDPVMMSGYQFTLGGIILMLIALTQGGHLTPQSGAAVPILVYLAFISSAAYTLWGILLKYHPVSNVTVFSFLLPVFGVFFSSLILHEKEALTIFTLLALVLVSFGILTVSREEKH